jgi:HSP20 family molecular chaperone IbpA
MNPMRIPVRASQSINVEDKIAVLYERIALRAYENFLRRGHDGGSDLEDWFAAEAELVTKPHIFVQVENNDLIVEVAVPDVDPAALSVSISPSAMLVTCQPDNGRPEVFGVVQFQQEIDLERVGAEYSQEMLKVVAALAEHGEYRSLEASVA